MSQLVSLFVMSQLYGEYLVSEVDIDKTHLHHFGKTEITLMWKTTTVAQMFCFIAKYFIGAANINM